MGDAAQYIEATRSLLRGEPLLLRTPQGTVPMALWPPGYPVLGALVALSGLPANDALLLVTRLSLAACVPALVWATGRVISPWMSLLAGILCMTAPGLLSNANLASTDAVFCLVSILAAGCVVQGRYLTLGILISLGMGLRNAAVALALAATLVAVADHPLSRSTIGRLGRMAVGGTPLFAVLMGWNVLGLGSLRPYVMPPSTSGIWRNLEDLGSALISDILPVYHLAHAIFWLVPLLLISLFSLCTCGYGIFRASDGSALRRFLLFAGSYVAIGLAMTVYARTRYEWGEPIWERHVAQYDWLIMPAVMALIVPGMKSMRHWAIAAVATLAILVVTVRFLEVSDKLVFYQRTAGEVSRIVETGDVKNVDPHIQLRQIYKAYENTPALTAFLHTVSPGCPIVSNLHDLIVAAYDLPTPDMPKAGLVKTPSVFFNAILPPGTVPATLLASDMISSDTTLPGDLALIAVPKLPLSLRVRSNAPDTCLPKVKP
jgi:hypothetical protein